jgi:hypothetical protein
MHGSASLPGEKSYSLSRQVEVVPLAQLVNAS